MNWTSAEAKKLIDAFKIFSMTPEGQMVIQYLQAQFLYPNPTINELCDGQEPNNDEKLGHHRVVLHILALMDQPST